METCRTYIPPFYDVRGLIHFAGQQFFKLQLQAWRFEFPIPSQPFPCNLLLLTEGEPIVLLEYQITMDGTKCPCFALWRLRFSLLKGMDTLAPEYGQASASPTLCYQTLIVTSRYKQHSVTFNDLRFFSKWETRYIQTYRYFFYITE